jgi:5,6-dimethylbenzimidazole synthase
LTEPPRFDAGFGDQLEALLLWRRDVRHFDRRIASLAPSVGNSQPWRFVRLRRPAIRARLAEHIDAQNIIAAGRYAELAQRAQYLSLKLHGLREAPELLAVFCDEQPTAGHGLGIATMPEMLRYSCVMAVHNLWLAARARGIGLGWVSIVEPIEIARLLDVPQSWTLIALLCIGFPEEPSEVPELERRGWQARDDWATHIFER